MKVSDIEFFNRLLDYKNVLYLCHRNADPDAIGSAYALCETFGGTIGLADGCNKVAFNMIEQIGIQVKEKPKIENYDIVIIVDTSTMAQLNNLNIRKYAIIDHHTTTALLEKAEFYIHEDMTSTVEIVFRMLKKIGFKISKKVGLALITGIITDTGHLKHATAQTFKYLSDIIKESGVDYFDALELMSSTPQDLSIRIALLKTAMRAKIERANNYIIAISYVSSYGGSAASMLINIGADVSFVGTIKEDGTVRVSGRAKRDLVIKGLNLGKLMEDIGKKNNGTGGGHSGAAGIDALDHLDKLLFECVEKTKKIILRLK